MGRHGSKSNTQGTWRFLLALLCIVLVVVCGTIQVAHIHSDGAYHADCSLCATAHVVAQAATLHVALHVAPHVTFLRISARPIRRSGTLSTFALFTRPPPVDAVLA
jgi:uncharacterized membrane protein